MDERTNALPVGTELEGYRVVALLGAGGFGITYKAVDLLLDRAVAIKEYLPSVLAGRNSDRKTVRPFGRQEQEQFAWGLERFRSEARTLVAFQHSHIVPVHRYFEANGTGYLVMAFQDGKSLADVIDAVGTLSEDEVLTILRPLATGLADVHAKGFLHRDIKPANIIIRRDGTPVLIDFGAARQAVTRQSRGLTAIVTEGYAPYEQYETDSHQGPWTDIYALGAVLYHCVTGHRPPEAPKRIAAQLRKQPDPMVPALIAAKGNYSESLLVAIDRALVGEEAKRPQDVREFMALVESRSPPAAAPGDPASLGAEAFMFEPPSQPLGRLPPPTPDQSDEAAAEVAGNLMVDAPSQPLGRRAPKVAPPAQPLWARSRTAEPSPDADADADPDAKADAETNAEADAEADADAEPRPERVSTGGNTLMVGGHTLIVGESDQQPDSTAPPRRAYTRTPGSEHAPEPSLASQHARKRRMIPVVFGAVAAVAMVAVAVAYFAQKQQGASPTPPTAQQTKADTRATAPAVPKASEEALARSRAAAPERLWEHLELKNGQDVVRRIFVLPNDQLLIAGGRIEDGSNSDIWLWRFDAKERKAVGERRSFPNARFNSGNAVILLPDGAALLAAERRSGANNSIVAWIARVPPEGEPQWQYTFAVRPLTIPYAITTLPNGDVIVVGAAKESDKGPQGWAARVSADGKKVLWDKVFGQPGDDSLQGVAVLPDGGIIAVGWANVERPAGDDRNLWILNLDADGNLRWEKKDLGDDADEKGKAVVVTAEGDIVVQAEVSRAPPAQPAPPVRPAPPGRPVAPGRPPPPEIDTSPIVKPWILRLGPDGAVRWSKRNWPGKDGKNDSLDAIVPAGDAGFVMAGSTESKGSGRKDGWLVRVDADGNQLWDQTFGEQFDDEFTALTVLLDGGVMVGGATVKIEASPGSTAARPQGEAKLWVMRLGYK